MSAGCGWAPPGPMDRDARRPGKVGRITRLGVAAPDLGDDENPIDAGQLHDAASASLPAHRDLVPIGRRPSVMP